MLFLTAFCCVQMQGSISHLKLSFPHIVPPKIWLRTFELYFVSWPIQTQRHETNFSRHHRRLLVCERIWAIIIFRYKSKKIWNRRESFKNFCAQSQQNWRTVVVSVYVCLFSTDWNSVLQLRPITHVRLIQKAHHTTPTFHRLMYDYGFYFDEVEFINEINYFLKVFKFRWANQLSFLSFYLCNSNQTEPNMFFKNVLKLSPKLEFLVKVLLKVGKNKQFMAFKRNNT